MHEPIQNKIVPHFLEGFYEYDIEEPATLGQVLLDFESSVENIKKVTALMRAAKFDSAECADILDLYYAGETSESETVTNEGDNYYYVLTMPELRDVEFALETLGDDVGEVRQKVDKLKSQLWQLLPDFYKGHALPMPQPHTYNPEKPYPYSCIEGSLVKARRAKLRAWAWGLEQGEEYSQHMPDDTAAPATIRFDDDDVIINGKRAATAMHWTEMHPFEDMLSFAEDVISNHDPTFFMIDPEGPPIYFCTSKAPSPQDVKLVVYWDSKGNMREEKIVVVLSGILKRRQLVESLINECGHAVEAYTSTAQENISLGYKDYADDQLSYAHVWKQKMERLKAII